MSEAGASGVDRMAGVGATAQSDAAAWERLGDSAADDRDMLRARLAELIAGTGPTLTFEPIFHIHTGLQIGQEALARFPGPMTTSEWFVLAHALGLGSDLELRILAEVVRAMPDHTGFVGINMSPDALLDPRSLHTLQQCDPAQVVVELTGQTTLPDLTALRSCLDELRSRGVRLAVHVDEFGAEMLQWLTWAVPAIVKFDPQITGALAAGRAGAASAVNFMAACRQIGVFTIAVGAESKAQVNSLRDAGIDAYQGLSRLTIGL